MAKSWSDYLGEFLSEKVPGVAGIKEGIATHQEDQQLFDRALRYIEQQGWLTDEAMQDVREHSRFGIGPIQRALNRLLGTGGSYVSATGHTTYNPEPYKLWGEDAYKQLAKVILHEYGHVLDFERHNPASSLEPLLANIFAGGWESVQGLADEMAYNVWRMPRPASSGKPGGNITPYAETNPAENFAEVFEAIVKFGSPWGNTQPVSDDEDSVLKHVQPWMIPIFEKVIQNYNKPVPSWWSDEPPYASDPAAGPREENAQELDPESIPRHTQGWTPPLMGGFSRDAPSSEQRAIFTDPAAGALAASPQELDPEKARLQEEAYREIYGY